jgi:enoyl-CoA hydratase/carnithine racemase
VHYDDLLFERRGAVALITFNRPAVLNALRGETVVALHEVLHAVEEDAGLRAVVLTGNGRAFSTGRDLKEEDALTATSAVRDAVLATIEQYQELTRRLTRMNKVVISALNGVAVGIGAELATASDIRLASPEARIAFPEVRRALFLTNGVLYRLPRIVGLGRAADWILSGRIVEAGELLSSGFVSRIVASDHVVASALEAAETIAANAPLSVRLAKELLGRAYEVDLEMMLELERDALADCIETEDYREGMTAFLEKREPNYRGDRRIGG